MLDEIDAIAKRRDDDQELGELKRLVTVLLQEIDDWPEGGLLVAASNHQELLDPAAWRRFEVQIEFGLPSHDAIAQSLRLFNDHDCVLDETWVKALAEVLSGQSFSDIERQMKHLRRQSVLNDRDLNDLLPSLIRQHIDKQSKASKKTVAARLHEAGLSQRAINDLTGLSRDTLRKMNSMK